MSNTSTISNQTPDRDAGGGPPVPDQAADQISERDEDRTEHDRSSEHRSEGVPACGEHRGAGNREGGGRGAVADDGREGEDQDVAAEFAEDHLAPAHRITQKKRHGAAFHLADHGVVRDQERDQGEQEDRQARQADDDDVESARADIAGGSASQERQRQGKRGQQQRGCQNPAVSQPFLDLLDGDDDDRPHAALS